MPRFRPLIHAFLLSSLSIALTAAQTPLPPAGIPARRPRASMSATRPIARAEPADGLAGGKVALLERIEWLGIPDPATAAAALQSGEIDFIEQPTPDILPTLERNAQHPHHGAEPDRLDGLAAA